MSEPRRRSFLARLRGLLRGLARSWMRDRENRNPRAVYEQAIAERTEQYAELKSAVAGILYMRNRLTAEIEARREELVRTQRDIERAVERDEDELATALIAHRHAVGEDLQRSEQELRRVSDEVDVAKSNLIRFRSEIRELEHEKLHALARLANARARRRIHEALEGLSLDGEMRALERVREHIARIDTEGRLAEELIFGYERVTSGASQDIKMATVMARAMATQFGMSDKLG
ncbi:MAG: PspA/IM30 family protein, partial [Myxococcota bacterium]